LGRKDFGDLINISGISLIFEDELSAFSDGSSAAAKSLTYEPTSITSNGVVWGTTSNGVILDSVINYTSSIEVLSNAINDGLETGQFRSLSIRDAGSTIFEVSGSATEWSVESGDVGFIISGNLPTSMSGLLDFVGYMSKIPDFLGIEYGYVWAEQTQQWIYTKTTPLGLSISERNDVIDGLRSYDIDRFEILPGDDFSAILTSEAGTNLDIITLFPEIAFDFSYIDLAQSLEILAETQYIELGRKDLSDLINISDISFRYENELSEFFEGTSPAAIAFGYQPTSITSNGVIWGSSTNGVFLDSSITNISTLDELTSSIENGLETGQFRSLSVYDDGKTIFELSGFATEWSITSDDTSLQITGDLPTSMSGLLNFLGNLSKIPDFLGIEYGYVWAEQTQQWIYTKTTPLGLSISERNDVIDGLRSYDIDRLKILKDEAVAVSIVSESGLINEDIGSFAPELELDFSSISLAETLERLSEIQNASLSERELIEISWDDAPEGSVTVLGVAEQGQTLTADTSTLSDEDGLGTLSYQWKANGADITGATSSTLTLGQSEVGKEITVSVSYTDDGGTAETMSSAATSAVTNVNDAPTITTSTSLSTDEDTAIAAIAFSGTDVDGDELTFTFSDPAKGSVVDNDDGTFAYTPDANANGSDSFTITLNDGTVDVTEAINIAIAGVNDLPTGSVTISGTATEGEALAAVTSNISDADDLGAFSYQWLRDGTDISGATASTYTLAQADVGAAISIRASYTDGGGTAESVTSAATQTIISSAPSIAPFDIVLVSETGGVATFEIYADASVDPENDGFGSFEFKMSHDPTDMLIDVSTVSPPQGFIGVPAYNSNTGVLELAGITIPNFTDLSAPIAIFNATILDTDNPIDITISDGRVDNVLQGNVSETFDFTSVDVTSTVVNIDGGQLSGVTVSYDFETPSGDQKTSELAVQSASGVSQAMARGSDATVTADKTIDTSSEDAIGAYDALQALRLAVGLDKSDGTSEWYDYIAADINKDGRVGADDALNILKFAVGLTDGPSIDWVFVDADADWSAIDRSTTTYNEGIQLSDIMVDSSVDMTGILVGDVDGSYIL
jgi:hypothetical protein